MAFSLFPKRQWSQETHRIMALMPQNGIFLTGIEGSDPIVDGTRRNQLKEAHDFYTNYKTRLQNIRNLGITWLRFGEPYSQVHLGPKTYNFLFLDEVVKTCDELGITIMADLLHFGLPDWMHAHTPTTPHFQNSDFPAQFADYARTFAKRFPNITHYTIVNEPFVTAHFSAKLALWNEKQTGAGWHDDRPFVRAVSNIARAAILGRQAIETVWQEEKRTSDLIFVQNESFEATYAAPGSGREKEAEMANIRRFAPLDLILGHHDKIVYNYFINQGMAAHDYDWFMANGRSDNTILGIDHYPACVHTYTAEGTIEGTPDDPYRLYDLVKDYWQRYPLPLLHTEVNAWPQHALAICHKTFDTLSRLRREDYPVLGMGWYGDDLQIGWHTAMSGPHSFEETPVGLFYKGQAQPVAVLFKHFAHKGLGEPRRSILSTPLLQKRSTVEV